MRFGPRSMGHGRVPDLGRTASAHRRRPALGPLAPGAVHASPRGGASHDFGGSAPARLDRSPDWVGWRSCSTSSSTTATGTSSTTPMQTMTAIQTYQLQGRTQGHRWANRRWRPPLPVLPILRVVPGASSCFPPDSGSGSLQWPPSVRPRHSEAQRSSHGATSSCSSPCRCSAARWKHGSSTCQSGSAASGSRSCSGGFHIVEVGRYRDTVFTSRAPFLFVATTTTSSTTCSPRAALSTPFGVAGDRTPPGCSGERIGQGCSELERPSDHPDRRRPSVEFHRRSGAGSPLPRRRSPS